MADHLTPEERERVRAAVAATLHRWQHPTLKRSDARCHCDDHAVLAVDMAQPAIVAALTPESTEAEETRP